MRALRFPLPRGMVVLLLLAAGAGCEIAGPDAPGAAPLALRPSDGLLSDPSLQALVDMQVARDAETLAVMLTAERAEVRARAALALASVQEVASLQRLVERLTEDPDASVRRDAALALGQLDAAEAVGPLSAALAAESDRAVRDRILEALGKIGAPEASTALLRAAVRSGEEARRTWALSVNGAVRGVITPPMQLHVLQRLRDAEPSVREAAAYFYGRAGDPRVWAENAGQVQAALASYAPDDPAATHLIKALGALGDPEDVGLLSDWAAKGADWRTRSEALTALAPHATDPAVTSLFLDKLDDPSEHVAALAAVGLSSGTYAPSVLQPLRAWVEAHPTRHAVVEPLMVLLARMDEREVVFEWIDGLAPDDELGWSVGLRGLGFLAGQEALDRLGTAVRSGAPGVRSMAIAGLGDRWVRDRRTPELVPWYFARFTEGLRSGNPDARVTSAQRLTDPLFVDMGAGALLVEAYRARLAEGDPRQAAEMLRLVASIGAPDAEALLRDALDHPAAVLRRIAASGLASVTGDSVEVDRTADRDGAFPQGDALGYDPAEIDWTYVAGLGEAPRLVFETRRGSFTVRMVPEEAPHTVQTMSRLAEEGRFDGTPFHRVIANFVAQGGDVDGGTGRGGPGFQITSEFNGLPYRRGSIGMASAGKDTEGSQFFLAHTRLPHLDGGYTVFGWVTHGMDVVDAIMRGDRIVSVTLERD